MIAKLTGRCAICSGRIIKGRSRITNLGDRTVRHWAHEACAERDPTYQERERRRAAKAMKSYRLPYKD